MTNCIDLALSTGLGPVIAIVIIIIFMGLTYKMAGSVPSIIVGIIATFALTYLDFLPVFWGIGIIFAFFAGLIYTKVLR